MTPRYQRVIAFLFLIALTAIGFSQTATTSLRGTIKDPSGAVVPNATITLTSSANGQLIKSTSNSAGQYLFNQIPPAKYNITISAPGFADQTKTAELLVNQPATIDFTESVQTMSEVVNVSATAQTLNTTDASMGNSVNNTMIQALPSEGRNVPDLLALQPGVLYLGQSSGRPSSPDNQNDSRSGSVNGGRSDQGNITVDGLDNNDQVNGYAFTGVLRQTQDSVEEFRVTTGNATADAGRSSGAQISMVTKSGTNKFHGSVYEYHRPTFTVANDWFNKKGQLDSGLPNVPPKLIRNNFGGAVGGPIFKDKLFFFANYEGQRQAENQVVSRTAPTANYKLGILGYQDVNGNNQTLSKEQVTQLDSGCQICNTSAYPYGPGPNPNVLAYLASMPSANGTSLGDGLNTGSYTFSSPNPVTLNTSIVKIDYAPGQKHRIFVRGNLQKDTTSEVEQFPGQGPTYLDIENSKGIAAGDTWSLTPNLVNDIRYGYIRYGRSHRGIGSGDYVDFRFMDTTTAETRSTILNVPVNNIVDNLSWNKGNHSLQFGGNWRLIHQNNATDANSFNSASSNPYYLGGNPPSPTTLGLPAYGNTNAYVIALGNLVGSIPSVTNVSNYEITSPTSGTALPEGALVNRHFKANEFEYYLQDSWRVLPNLTITFGIRHTILQTPYETKGQQVAPTIDTHTFFLQREAAALQGQVYEPNLEFAPNGPVYHRPGYWAKSKNNIAPRFAIAYSPDAKTSIRAGFGIYYDHYGQQLVSTFDQNGSFGLNSQVTNPAGTYSIDGTATHPAAPRFINNRTFPPINPVTPSPTASFPYTPPTDGFGINWGIDSKLKTPYSESFNLSVQRELPGGFTLETAYYGRLGRHLLQSLDLTQPVDFVDTQGGGDYFTAAAQLSRLVDVNGGNYPAPVPAIKYFEDVFPFMAGYDYTGESATQAIYNNEWAPYRSNLGATSALADLDFYCVYNSVNGACPDGYQPKFWQNQFASLYALATMGTSYYNAGQFILRHPSAHGLQMDFSYTLSKSIDMGSDAERGTEFNGGAGNFSNITNAWKPYLSRGPSDFDTRHLITADWVYLLPIGRGKYFLGNANWATDALVGGWQWSGINRWSSALPFSLADPGWSTDWQISSDGVVTGKVKMRKHLDSNGNPQVFDDPAAINTGTLTGGPVRLSYPGEAGERNNFRGDGFFSIDSGLAKSWKFGEFGALKFAWEVFNVTNAVRFDTNSNTSTYGGLSQSLTGASLGVYSKMLTTPRRMQFSLRYDF